MSSPSSTTLTAWRRCAPVPGPLRNCTPGQTFPHARITADADLIADGVLLDFKSDRHPHRLPEITAWQLLGYLLDTVDQYRIDTVGLYMTRSGIPAAWPVDEFEEPGVGRLCGRGRPPRDHIAQ